MYIAQTFTLCRQVTVERFCDNYLEIVRKESKQLSRLMTTINTIYVIPTDKRRGLIDGIGTVAKTLFGTMDANDDKLINEQLHLLENNQQTIRHTVKNQIQILNSTITHLDNLENILDYNGKLLNRQVSEYKTREDINEHFTIIIAVIIDLIQNAKDVIEYLTYVSKGEVHPILTPINDIITQLQKATSQTQELYFPFEIEKRNWLKIEKYVKVSAYRDNLNIYTILYFPLISHPAYSVIKVFPLPIHDHEDIFTLAEIHNNLIILNKEGRTFLPIGESEIKECIKIEQNYICDKTYPIHKMNSLSETPCEIQMYLQQQRDRDNCNTKHIIISNTIWIPLHNPHEWLYSTTNETKIAISCENHSEERISIKNTGKITLQDNCKITTQDVTIENKGIIQGGSIDTYLPKTNIPLLRDSNDSRQDIKNIVHNHAELAEIRSKLKILDSELRNNDETFYTQKQFIVPMATSGLLTIALIALIVWISINIKRNIEELRTTILLKKSKGGRVL